MLAAFAIVCGSMAFLRVDGIDGDQQAAVRWRWSTTAEDLYLASRAASPDTATSRPTTRTEATPTVLVAQAGRLDRISRSRPARRGARPEDRDRLGVASAETALAAADRPRLVVDADYRRSVVHAGTARRVGGGRLPRRGDRPRSLGASIQSAVLRRPGRGRAPLQSHIFRGPDLHARGVGRFELPGGGQRQTVLVARHRGRLEGAPADVGIFQLAAGRRRAGHRLRRRKGGQRPVGLSRQDGRARLVGRDGARQLQLAPSRRPCTDGGKCSFSAIPAWSGWTRRPAKSSGSTRRSATPSGGSRSLARSTTRESSSAPRIWAWCGSTWRKPAPRRVGTRAPCGRPTTISSRWTVSFTDSTRAFLCCVDAATGKRRWKAGRYGHGQLLLLADQQLLLVISEKRRGGAGLGSARSA